MATVKIKLRPSSVEGKAGVIFYQITHNRKNATHNNPPSCPTI